MQRQKVQKLVEQLNSAEIQSLPPSNQSSMPNMASPPTQPPDSPAQVTAVDKL